MREQEFPKKIKILLGSPRWKPSYRPGKGRDLSNLLILPGDQFANISGEIIRHW